MPEIPRDLLNQILRQARWAPEDMESIIQEALLRQRILVPYVSQQQQVYAGGTNLCPNSDFAWSEDAATMSGITPSTASATNYECHRVFRQAQGANISTQRLRTDSGAYPEPDGAYVPIWDRINGVAQIGWDGGTGSNYDIAIQLTNNWLRNAQNYFIRMTCSTVDTTPLPDGTKLYAGLWYKNSSGQGWVDGNGFTLSYDVLGVKSNKSYSYKVIAYSDSGAAMESAVLTITDGPETLSLTDQVRISYSGANGLIEFKVYRKDNATGEVNLIARDRNSTKLFAYDAGQNLEPVPSGSFPTVTSQTMYRAYAEVLVEAYPLLIQKTFNNLNIRIPSAFDASDIDNQSTWIRIGLIDPVTNNRQLCLDTIWFSETYNIWSPSPWDIYPSGPSTTITTSVPTGGNIPTDVPSTGGGTTCVHITHDLLMADGWEVLGDAEVGDMACVGPGEDNVIVKFIDGIVSQYYVIEFDSGLVIEASPTHPFLRSFNDNSGVLACNLKIGDVLQGGRRDGFQDVHKRITVTNIEFVTDKMMAVRAVKVNPEEPIKRYAVGDRNIGEYVWCKNLKPAEDPY